MVSLSPLFAQVEQLNGWQQFGIVGLVLILLYLGFRELQKNNDKKDAAKDLTIKTLQDQVAAASQNNKALEVLGQHAENTGRLATAIDNLGELVKDNGCRAREFSHS